MCSPKLVASCRAVVWLEVCVVIVPRLLLHVALPILRKRCDKRVAPGIPATTLDVETGAANLASDPAEQLRLARVEIERMVKANFHEIERAYVERRHINQDALR